MRPQSRGTALGRGLEVPSPRSIPSSDRHPLQTYSHPPVDSTTLVIQINTIVIFAEAAWAPKMGCSMAAKKKQIQHDEIVALFGRRLRQLRLERGFSQA